MKKIFKKILFYLKGKKITLRNKNTENRVLISYTTLSFTHPEKESFHSNRWEAKTIAQIFYNHGFTVDIIDHTNKKFIPKKKYRYCLDISDNLERLDRYLNKDCLKIFHIPAAQRS